MRRKTDVGVVTENDAKAVIKSYMKYLQVQSMGQHDRKVRLSVFPMLMMLYYNLRNAGK